jgi:hypothetical protein
MSMSDFEKQEAFERELATHSEDCDVWLRRDLEDCDCFISQLDSYLGDPDGA